MKRLFLLLACSLALYAQKGVGYLDLSLGRMKLPQATFASAPSSPAAGQIYEFTDSSVGCTGGGSAVAFCYYTGSGWAQFGGGSTGGRTIFRCLSQAGIGGCNLSWNGLTNAVFSTTDSTHITQYLTITANSTGNAFWGRALVTSTNPSVSFTVAVNSTDNTNSGSMALAYACIPAGTLGDNPSFTSLTAITLATIASTSSVYQSTQSVTCTGTTAAPADLIVQWTPTAPSGGTMNLIWMAVSM